MPLVGIMPVVWPDLRCIERTHPEMPADDDCLPACLPVIAISFVYERRQRLGGPLRGKFVLAARGESLSARPAPRHDTTRTAMAHLPLGRVTVHRRDGDIGLFNHGSPSIRDVFAPLADPA